MAGAKAAPGEQLSAPPPAAFAWRGGEARHREELAPVLPLLLDGARAGAAVEVLREKPGRRRLLRARSASGADLFVKHFAARDPAWKRRLGLTPAGREFRALRSLRRAGVAVPEALAHAEDARGDELLLLRFLPGEPLAAALARPPAERRALLRRLGEEVRRLHAAGRVHRDLHRENVWVTPDGPVLIDLQQSLPLAPPWLVRRDQGELDASLAPLLSLADRVRLRAALLGLRRPFDTSDRAALRAVGRVSEARLRSHVRSRTRRSLQEGRLYAKLRCERGQGMRLREIAEADAIAALERAPESRAPARTWLAGHGLRARGIGAPRPLAFAARGGAGRVALEAPATGGDPIDPAECADLGVALHRHRVQIGADAVFARDAGGRLGPLPLEQVAFPRRLSRELARRIEAATLRAIEASAAEPAARERALRRYRLRLRFYASETVTQRK